MLLCCVGFFFYGVGVWSDSVSEDAARRFPRSYHCRHYGQSLSVRRGHRRHWEEWMQYVLSSPASFLPSVISILSSSADICLLYILDNLMVCTYWLTFAVLHGGCLICPACFPFILCSHGHSAFGSAWVQTVRSNVILCQQALQVMYVLLPSGELWMGWNKGRVRILFDNLFLTVDQEPKWRTLYIFVCEKTQREREQNRNTTARFDAEKQKLWID